MSWMWVLVGIWGGALLLSCGDQGDDPPSNIGGGGADTGGTSSSGGETSMGTGGETDGVGGRAESTEPPALLSETGLFDGDPNTLHEGVRSFTPNHVLWSDGATKRRFVYLPPGEQIDTSDMEFWNYPSGTKLWKEFTRDGVLVETRLLQKRPNGMWWMMAYQWRPDGSDADAVPEGVDNAWETEHDIPSSLQCTTCHARMRDRILGFSAIQLDDEGGMGGASGDTDVHLSDLVAEGLLTDDPPEDLTLPGSDLDRAVLGYLHANCGNCHNKSSSIQSRVNMNLWLPPDPAQLDILENTPTYKTAVNAETSLPADAPSEEATHRVLPGHPESSNVFLRMESRGETFSMPPLGTELVDKAARDQLEEWILGL